MKIEKITENKIRVILKVEDFNNQSTDLHSTLLNPKYVQNILLDILEEAKLELNFNIDGYRLLVERFSSDDEHCVFTITKYKSNDLLNNSYNRKIVTAKGIKKNHTIYKFDDFEAFCSFCSFAKNLNKIDIKSSLYLYNNTYYLSIINANKNLSSIISEFTKPVSYSKIFDAKLKEHGKVIIKSKAISTGIKYFAS